MCGEENSFIYGMKKIAALLFLLTFFYSQHSFAQIIGSVVDSTDQALPFCNVMLLKSADSTVVTGTTGNELGSFSLEKKDSGDFLLLVLFSGYSKYYSTPFSLSAEQTKYNAGKIMMHADPAMLHAVEVVAQKPFMQQQLDRTVFNIENSVISSGNNALEVLRKLPGVSVDNNDNIQVRGKAGVIFMIDGRTSYLSGADIATYLKSIDASQIEKIEVITNPSAKYDAAGNAIINIVLIKNKNLGFNGQLSANYGQGFYYETDYGLTANYRMKKWNFFGAGNYTLGEFALTKTNTTIYNTSPQQTIIGQQRFTNEGVWYYGRAGVDFTPNDRQTFGFVMDAYGFVLHQNRTDESKIYNANGQLDSTLYTVSPQKTNVGYNSFDLNYKFDIDTTGKELTADLNYAPFSITAARRNVAYYYDAANQEMHPSTTLKSNLPSTAGIWAGKIDYVQPFGKKIKMEVGGKGSYISTDNNAQYYNVIQDADVIDTLLTNHFLYTEKIYSAYANYIQSLNDKIDIQVGFRGEETQAQGKQLVNDSTVSRKYFNLFPSAFVNWKVDSSNTLNFSYSRRIDRPDYSELNPFRFFTNPFTYSSGNPYLHPQMSDNYQITHIFKNVFSTSIGYLHMTDVFTNVIHQDDSSLVFFSRNENLSTYNCYNIMFAATLPITNWFTSITSLNIFHDHYFGLVQGQNYSAQNVTFWINTLNSITLKKNWSMEVSFFYRNLNLNAVWKEFPVASLDFGVKKKFANGRGSVSVNCSDIFKTTFQNGSAVYQNVNFEVKGFTDSRRVRVSLTWKLGKSQYERNEQQRSAEDELNRAK